MSSNSSERLPKSEATLEQLHQLGRLSKLDAETVTGTALATHLQGISKSISAIALAYGGVEPSGTAHLYKNELSCFGPQSPNATRTETVLRCYLTQGAYAGKILVARAVSGADGAKLGIHHKIGTTSRTCRPDEITHDVEVPGNRVLDTLLMQEPYRWREGDYLARDLRGQEPKFGTPFEYNPLSTWNDAEVYTGVLQDLSSELLRAIDQQHPSTFITVDDV
jgi:hypothetical protein